ncbi:MAG TPA: ACT domain-containing protein, partial [Ktedonobacteraceae bacterium]
MSNKPQIIFLISCPDRPGVVAAVSHFIFEHGGNILESDQYSTNEQECQFFMRIGVAEGGFALTAGELREAFQPIAERFQMQWSVSHSSQRKRVGILVSKLDHCLTDLLWRWKSGELSMDIPFIISNHPDLEGLASMYGVPYHYFPV